MNFISVHRHVPSKCNWTGDCNFSGCSKGNIVVFGKSQVNIASIEKNTSVEESFHSLIELEESSEENIADSGNEDNNFKGADDKNVRNTPEATIYVIDDSLIED